MLRPLLAVTLVKMSVGCFEMSSRRPKSDRHRGVLLRVVVRTPPQRIGVVESGRGEVIDPSGELPPAVMVVRSRYEECLVGRRWWWTERATAARRQASSAAAAKGTDHLTHGRMDFLLACILRVPFRLVRPRWVGSVKWRRSSVAPHPVADPEPDGERVRWRDSRLDRFAGQLLWRWRGLPVHSA